MFSTLTRQCVNNNRKRMILIPMTVVVVPTMSQSNNLFLLRVKHQKIINKATKLESLHRSCLRILERIIYMHMGWHQWIEKVQL